MLPSLQAEGEINMTDSMTSTGKEPNVVDRAAQSADKALEATRRVTGAAIDSVADKVHGLRDNVSPRVDKMFAPVDQVAKYTQDAPLKSLLAAAAVGAVLMALVSLMARTGR
jgi:ElaB/YqjD/DUF883 family membrane-anchored ribosome-binding protein